MKPLFVRNDFMNFLLESFLPLTDSGITNSVLAFSGKTSCVILVLMTFVSNGGKKIS